ncbi:MAG TPA: amino acid permease [Steroidobacteraceae bacterium]|nr:amino acid permease [Steroidobacteraceae bacterium]
MSDKKQVGSVTYEQAGQDYFAKRGFKRYARIWSLWALGVGAVISGHYSGWNFGIGPGGFGGIFVAGFLIMIMYWGLVFSIAEMSPALPHTGAAYSFARSAMGPWGGFITGLAENIEYVITPAVIVFFIGSYLTAIFETGPQYQPVWWLVSYLVFLTLNLRGAELSFKVSVIVTVSALAVLAVYWISAIPYFDFERWALNIGAGPEGAVELPEGGGSFLPFGWAGAFAAMPFAVWLFLAIEQLPLAAEETHDPKEHMPKGIILGMATLVVSAFLTMFLNAGVGGTAEGQMHGAFSLGTSAEPLLDGFRVTIGGNIAKLLALLAVVGLIASFHTIIYAYGRQIFSLSRAGYFPQALSETHGAHKTPNRALIAGTVLGFAVMMVVWYVAGAEKGGAFIGGTLLNMAVFGAMLSYALQGLSFILLRVRMPHIARPYRSPLGNFGAAVTIVIALVTLYYQLKDPVYQKGVFGAAIWYVLGILYFALVGRHKLVLSPEEEFALTKGTHGHPETEGYGKTTL